MIATLRFVRAFASRAPAAAGSTAALLAKWQALLNSPTSEQQQRPGQLQLLLHDALQIYKTDAAAAVMPDGVTDLLITAYQAQHSDEKKVSFSRLLARDFGVDRGAVAAAVQLWHDKASGDAQISPEALFRIAERLSAAAQPLYMQLLLPISQHPAGIAFLVGMRSDLQQLLKQHQGEQGAALRALDRHLRTALARWFSVGLLQLQRITWEDSSGQLLERVMAAEAVHRMQHLEELRRRLQQADRRVFAFLHPSLPGEPLVVLHTAILDTIPTSMTAVFAPGQQPEGLAGQESGSSGSSSGGSGAAGSVACFYSISSSQPGLSGIDLGNFLIKRVAQLLLSELAQLEHLVTLSPIPGFRAWLITKLQVQAASAVAAGQGGSSCSDGPEPGQGFLRPAEAATVGRLWQLLHCGAGPPASVGNSSSSSSSSSMVASAAGSLLEMVLHHSWLELPEPQQQELQPVLRRLCAVYLLTEKRRRFALDPVAHFHLKNGAQLFNCCTRADLSRAGLDRSCGLMVTYKYVLDDVAANNQRYLTDYTIAAADSVRQLLG